MKYLTGEHYRLYGKKCYEKNKEKYKPIRKKWDETHRERRVEIAQAYARRNKNKIAKYNFTFQKTITGIFRTYKHSAKSKGHEFNLSIDDFSKIISQPCKYCGEIQERRGIDRIDNSKGYTKENSAPCCKICNFMKKAMTANDFLDHVKKITQHNDK